MSTLTQNAEIPLDVVEYGDPFGNLATVGPPATVVLPKPETDEVPGSEPDDSDVAQQLGRLAAGISQVTLPRATHPKKSPSPSRINWGKLVRAVVAHDRPRRGFD